MTPGGLGSVVPSRAVFRALAAGGRMVPVYREVYADQETPVSAFRKIDDGAHAFLLESLGGGETWGRISLLGSRPALVFTARGAGCEILEQGVTRPGARAPAEELAALLAQRQAVALPGLPRSCGGAVGFLGPGAACWFDAGPAADRGPQEPPDAVLLFTDVVSVFDHVAHTIKVVTHAWGGSDPDGAWQAAAARLDAELARLARPLPWPESAGGGTAPEPDSSLTREAHRAAVERIREHIRAGDLLQATLARRLDTPVREPAFEAYRALRVACPAPFMHFLRLGDLCLAGASPGILVRRTGNVVEARPLSGGRARGRTASEDERLADELRADERERAAHVLLVDVARSDLGRVAEFGTVETAGFMTVERDARQLHLASTVRGRARPGLGPLDLSRACFPAAGLCGVPRGRAQEVLAALEGVPRSVHSGVVGHFGYQGDLDLCGASRTMIHARGRASWWAGAVISADTDPESAWRESEDDSRSPGLAVERSERGRA